MSEEYRYEGDVNYDPYNGAPDVAGAGMPVAVNRAEGDVNYDPYNGDAGAGGYRTGKRPQAGYATDGSEGEGPGTGASSDDGPGVSTDDKPAGAGGAASIPGAARATIPGVRLPSKEETAGLRLAGAGHGEAKQLTPEQEAVMGYDEQIEALKAAAEATRDETPEQRKKRERLERSRKIVGAVTDGLSALGNLFFAARYAPNMYNPQHSALGKVAGSIERAKAEREANTERHINYMLRLGDARNAKAKTLREMAAQHEAQKHALERERKADEYAEKKEEREDRKAEQQELMFQARYALQLGKLTEQGYRNAIAEVKAGKIAELTDAQIQRLNRSGTGGSGNTGQKTSEWTAYNPETGDKKIIHATGESHAWSQCPDGYVIKQKPTESESTTVTEKTDRRGKPSGTTTTTTTTKRNGGSGGESSPKKKTGVNWK